MLNVNQDYYRLFYYVCRYRSLTKAANILQMSQPNMTRGLNRLEAQLGCKLLVRSTRGVTLTPEGEALYAHVAIAQEQLLAGENELEGITSLQTGSLTIDASETALHILLLKKMRAFHREYPGIRLRIANHSTPQAIQALERGLADFCVVTTPTQLRPAMRQTLLDPFQDVLVAGEDFAFLKGRRWRLEQLQEYPLICLGSETMTYAFYRQLYLRCGLELEPDTEAATTDQILPMVQSGLGLGFVPRPLAENALASGQVFQVDLVETIPLRQIALIRDTRRSPSPAARQFLRLLCEGQEVLTETEGRA